MPTLSVQLLLRCTAIVFKAEPTIMTTPHYINGHWVAGAGAQTLTAYDPSLAQPIAELQSASPQQVEQAVAAARQALPAWQATSASERAGYLHGFARQLTERRQALISLQMHNNGKPRHEAEVDLDDAIATFSYYAGLAQTLPEQQGQAVALAVPGFTSHTYRAPSEVACSGLSSSRA